jgi:hypothetical protein
VATRQFLAHRLSEFAAACFSSGKNCKTGKSFCISSSKFKVAQTLLEWVVYINDRKGQEK